MKSTARAVRAVLIVGLLGIVVAVVGEMSQSGTHLSGSNRVPAAVFVAMVGPHRTICQKETIIPIDTSALQLTIGTFGRPLPPLSVRIRSESGETVDLGRARAKSEGVVSIFLDRMIKKTLVRADVCIRNGGSRQVTLAGFASEPLHRISAGVTSTGSLNIDYVRVGQESWFQFLPVIEHRFGLAKPGILGSWSLWLALGLFLLAVAVAVRTFWNEVRNK